MKIPRTVLICCAAGLLAGCASKKQSDRFFMDNTPIDGQEATVDRNAIRFPGIFLQDDFELHDTGHIPRTPLIGAGMSAKLELAEVRTRFNDVLHYNQWETDSMEMGQQYFRIQASHEEEFVEIRAVQGTSGPTQIFLLYTPVKR